MRAAILCASGLLATPPCGVWRISQVLRAGYTDPEQVAIQYSTWNGEAEHFADLFAGLNPELIIHVGHSFGDGVDLLRFNSQLATVHNRAIDLAILIDPVPHTLDGPLDATKPFAVPLNVKQVVGIRTINYRDLPWLPRGHDVDHPNVSMRLCFGTNLPVSNDPYLCNVNDPAVVHDTIDDNLNTRDLAIEKIRELVG